MTADLSSARERFFGRTTNEWIQGARGELDDDAVGFAVLVGAGRSDFGFSGDELTAFVRAALHDWLRYGAVPVAASQPIMGAPWVQVAQYGSDIPKVIDNLIAEWLDSGEDPPFGGLWFARRERFRKLKP